MANPRKPNRRHALEWGSETFLRFPRQSDLHAFLAASRRSKQLLHPWVRAIKNAQEYSMHLKGARNAGQRRTLVCRIEDGAIAGFVNFNVITHGALESAALGYAAFVPYAAQGYMREGLALALRHGFRTLALHRLEANIQTSNQRSVRLITRAGFRLEGFSPRYLKINGRWRDHLRFALLKEDWEKAPR